MTTLTAWPPCVRLMVPRTSRALIGNNKRRSRRAPLRCSSHRSGWSASCVFFYRLCHVIRSHPVPQHQLRCFQLMPLTFEFQRGNPSSLNLKEDFQEKPSWRPSLEPSPCEMPRGQPLTHPSLAGLASVASCPGSPSYRRRCADVLTQQRTQGGEEATKVLTGAAPASTPTGGRHA